MKLVQDVDRGKLVAGILYPWFSGTGIFGRKVMPESAPPIGVEAGSVEHILFLTLTVAIDYQRDADSLWTSSRKSFQDPRSHYLYDPKSVSRASLEEIQQAMKIHRLCKKVEKDAKIWRTISRAFHEKWEGDPRNFLADCDWNAPFVLARLRQDRHFQDGQYVDDFPFLRGEKIGPLWLRILRDQARITSLRRLEEIRIPVDIHIARGTLTTGVVRGSFQGKLPKLFHDIKEAWFASVQDLQIEGHALTSLDLDEPLWHLSRYGCTHRVKESSECGAAADCELKDLCIPGRINIHNGEVELAT